MKIELKKMWLVARDKNGEPEMLNGEPISASPHELTIVDTDTESGEPCEASYCTDFCICPDCHHAFRDFGEVNLRHGVMVFRVPCLQPVYDAIRDEVMKILAADYPDVTINRCAGLPQMLVDSAALNVAADIDDGEPDIDDLDEVEVP